jgi:hypothetical protein
MNTHNYQRNLGKKLPIVLRVVKLATASSLKCQFDLCFKFSWLDRLSVRGAEASEITFLVYNAPARH